jgi:protein-S-isoprenylcysteine O-methyltransferase Ste14
VFPPVFPICIPALAPLNPYAPLVWLAGVACLWLTRYTHQLGRRWGGGYYLLSALIRPAGVVLLAAGWLALYAPFGAADRMLFGRPVGWLPRGNWLDWLWWAGLGLSFALDVWAILALGLRRSFLFRHVEDRLVTRGPYALVRHPQFLSTIGVTFFGIRLFDPQSVIPHGWIFYPSLHANWVLLVLALWLLSILEERELEAHFGAEWAAYARRVPRLWPTFPALWAAVGRRLAGWQALHPAAALVRKAEARWGQALYALARLAGLGLIAVACGTIVVAARQLALEGGPGSLLPAALWAEVLSWLGTAGFVALAVWAIATAGLRPTVAFWAPPAVPPRHGPFALVRHPLYLAAAGVTLLATRPFAPWTFHVSVLGRIYPFGAHWLPYVLLIWLVAVVEDRALAASPAALVEAHAARVPRLFPN